MLEAELLHNKTYTKTVKVAKMMEFIKTCDQNPCQFWQFFQLHNHLPPLSAQEKISSENTVREECAIPVYLGDNGKHLGKSFAWGHE